MRDFLVLIIAIGVGMLLGIGLGLHISGTSRIGKTGQPEPATAEQGLEARLQSTLPLVKTRIKELYKEMERASSEELKKRIEGAPASGKVEGLEDRVKDFIELRLAIERCTGITDAKFEEWLKKITKEAEKEGAGE